MNQNSSDMLRLLDLLYIDENVIDQRLSIIMNRDTYDHKHLYNASVLLNYKLIINEAESEECDNESEYNFLFKLIHQACDENIDMVCKITKLILQLNKSSLSSKIQHLLQQLLPDLSDTKEQNGNSELELKTTFISLRLCDCLLDVLIENNALVTLHAVSVSFENIMKSSEFLIKYFLLNTVPRIHTILPELQVLENIWKYISSLKQEEWLKSLKYLTTLADLYFSPNAIILIDEPQFWELILQGLYSSKLDLRKSSLYLVKRSLEQLTTPDILKKVSTREVGYNKLHWNKNKSYFRDFITLFECLEEQQSNIVLPALYIFENIKGMDKVWLNSLFKLGFGHDSKQVKLKCLQEYLKHGVETQYEAEILLKSMNDMSLFSCALEVDTLIRNYQMINSTSLLKIFAEIPKFVWSPIPFHYVVGVTIDLILTRIKFSRNTCDESLILDNKAMIYQVLSDINNMSCNIPLIREKIHHKAAELFIELCKGSNWRDLKSMKIVDPKKLPRNRSCEFKMNDIYVKNGDENEFADVLLLSSVNMIIASPFLSNSPRCIEALTAKISAKFSKIELVIYNTTYVDFSDFLEELDFINIWCLYYSHILLSTLGQIPNSGIIPITHTIQDNLITLIDYMQTILSNNQKISYNDGAKLCEVFNNITNLIKKYQPHDRLLKLNQSILSLHQKCVKIMYSKNCDIERTILCYKILNNLHEFLILNFKQGEVDLDQIPKNDWQNAHTEDSLRRLSSILNHEYWCLLSKYSGDTLLRIIGPDVSLSSGFDTIMTDAIEICDSTTLKFVLTVVNTLLDNSCNIFDINILLSTIWKRINDIKSLSKEHSKCLQIFLAIFLNKAITRDKSKDQIVLAYFKEILELSNSVETYNYLLINMGRITAVDIDADLLSVMISESLIFSPYQRRDQLIMDGVLKTLKKEMKLEENHNADKMHHTLNIITNQEGNTLKNILNLTKKKMDAKFLNKKRYHQGSQAHKELFNSLKLMLMIGCCENSTIDEETLHWCIDLLCQLPHQPDVKTCLEWYIALYFCYKELSFNASPSQVILEKLPTASKFIVLYNVLKNRLLNGNYILSEYDCVMELLLTSIMGPTFNLRLQAQFLAKELFQILPIEKYAYTITLVTKALTESEEEKNYIKIKNDYFYNKFDLVKDLNFEFIYNVLPCLYCDEEMEDLSKFPNISKQIQGLVNNANNTKFAQTWLKIQSDKSDDYSCFNLRKMSDKLDTAEGKEDFNGVIQKKYIPWKNMCDIDVYEVDQVKNDKRGDMIVVASLVDKLPNLGGMARTSEVFAVKTFVIDNLRHVQDRQFQGLSMSAERWVEIEEVRPGQALKEYLLRKKAEGYLIVAAEQASTSVMLQAFQFPKKCLLLLGHEKNGVPCDLLPYMDFCVEIPQKGFVRSLNVHVTASIFIWEYTKQHLC